MHTYKIVAYVKGSDEDASALRNELAQIVYDEFELGSVFDVSVDPYDPPKDTYVMALCMVELESGLNKEQISRVLSILPDKGDYMPIEFHENNTSAYGFVSSDYYQQHNYEPGPLSDIVTPILGDMNLESVDGVYNAPDGRLFYMGYFRE